MIWTHRRGAALLAAGLSLWLSSVSQADPPPISDPDMRAPAGSMPGTFPETVTAANINIAPIPGSVLGGGGSNNLQVSFPSSGPIKWTESRHNEGDIALLVGPFDPNDPSYYPPNAFVDDYKPLESGQPFANTTLAWRVNREAAALLATVRHNGRDQGDNYFGQPVGTTHGIAYFNSDFGQGWGYRMNDGVFANGGNASVDLQMGIAGSDDGNGEASSDTAVAMFPYSEGWLGAWVDGDSGDFFSGSPNVDPSSVQIDNFGLATVNLPNIDPMHDGMLFVAPTSSGNSSDIAAAFPTPNGWRVTVREDDDADFSGQSYNIFGDNSFQFLYLPYDAPGMVGGHVSGNDGSLINAGGTNRFSVARRGSGEYAISVTDSSGATLTEDNGMLVLSVAGAISGSDTLADRKFLSYEFDETTNEFVVQSRELVAINSPNSTNQFGDDLALRDVDFYFAFVDFANPLRLSLGCDFDSSGTCDLNDIDTLVAAIVAGSTDAMFDLNGDGSVDQVDVNAWLGEAGELNLGPGRSYLAGDADLDGNVDGADFLTWNTSKFSDTGLWSLGDFDANGTTDGQDFLIWNGNKFQSSDVTAVPEPAVASLLLVAGICLLLRSR